MIKTIKILVLLMMLTACGDSNSSYQLSEDSFIPGKFQASDLSFYKKNEKDIIRLGMSKQEVEDILGEPIRKIDFFNIYEYSGVKVHYNKNNIVNALMIDDNTKHNKTYMSPRGIQYGDTVDSIVSKYGDQAIRDESGSSISLTYIIEKVDDEYISRNSIDQVINVDNTYLISMLIDKYGMLFIMIADYYFGHKSEF
jgi:hypothetical protein